ncbi:MAG: cytochrome c-type biogenesis protein CcmH [Gemmatimonadota bacterium]|nr:cytochrome c-type biogenesis protein CcmH [Gemmatimonadota bacterium]
MSRSFALVLLALLGLAAAPALSAQAPQSVTPAQAEAAADRAIGRIKSPYCPGLMLEVCPSPQAAELRDTIAAWAGAGQPADSIVEAVLAQVGEEYRAYPKAAGQGILAWAVPPIALVTGLLIVALVLRHLRRSRPENLPELDEEQERRIEEALDRLEKAEREASEVY